MSDDADLDLIRRFTTASWADDDSELDQVLAPDFVAHNGDDDVVGVAGQRAFAASQKAAFGHIDAIVDEMIASGPFVAERWSATSDGGLRVHGITTHRIADGRIAEQWATMSLDQMPGGGDLNDWRRTATVETAAPQ